MYIFYADKKKEKKSDFCAIRIISKKSKYSRWVEFAEGGCT